jgi:hypothetical protein
MKYTPSAKKALRKSKPTPGSSASAGPQGVAFAPPASGLEVMDRGALLQKAVTAPSEQQASPIQPRSLPSGAIQAKLAINPPNDIYEQEAKRVADQVMRMPGPTVARERRDTTKLAELPVAPAIVHEVLGRSGQPLDPATRSYFEPRFGTDFSDVRVHTDEKAVESARAVNARAYTAGRDVVFGAGQYAPGATEGQRLLAHELVHTLQQTAAGTHEAQPTTIQRAEMKHKITTTGLLGLTGTTKENEKITDETYEANLKKGKVKPYPGCTIEWNMPKQISIWVNFQLTGVEADATNAKQIQDSINSYWNKSWTIPFFGPITLKTKATVTYNPTPDYSKYAVIELFRSIQERSTISKFGGGRPQNRKIRLNLEGMDISWDPAHEFGHYLGLDDKYVDQLDAAGNTVSVTDPEWKGNIMAETKGIVEFRNIIELISWWANWVKPAPTPLPAPRVSPSNTSLPPS